MSSTRNLDHRLATLARSGRGARAIGAILRGEGYDVSDATVGRRLAVLRGPQRVTVRARSTAPAPPPPLRPSTDPEALEHLVAVALLAWIDAQPDPDATEAWIHDALEARARAAGEVPPT